VLWPQYQALRTKKGGLGRIEAGPAATKRNADPSVENDYDDGANDARHGGRKISMPACQKASLQLREMKRRKFVEGELAGTGEANTYAPNQGREGPSAGNSRDP